MAKKRTAKDESNRMGDLTEWHTTRETAQLLNIKEASVRVLLFLGKLTAEKKGNQSLIHSSEIERYKNSKSERGRPKNSA